MENKQTAVEWLVIQLANKHNEFQALTFYHDHHEEIKKAKQMEEEQITDAYVSGSYDMVQKEYNPQKYYDETYGSIDN